MTEKNATWGPKVDPAAFSKHVGNRRVQIRSIGPALVSPDISHGKEMVPIPVINDTGDGAMIDCGFQYVTEYVFSDERVRQFVENSRTKEAALGPPEVHQCSLKAAQVLSVHKQFYTDFGQLYDCMY